MRHNGEAVALVLWSTPPSVAITAMVVFWFGPLSWRAAFSGGSRGRYRKAGWPAVPAELAFLFERRRPEMRAFANDDGADGIHHHERRRP